MDKMNGIFVICSAIKMEKLSTDSTLQCGSNLASSHISTNSRDLPIHIETNIQLLHTVNVLTEHHHCHHYVVTLIATAFVVTD